MGGGSEEMAREMVGGFAWSWFGGGNRWSFLIWRASWMGSLCPGRRSMGARILSGVETWGLRCRFSSLGCHITVF
jgi:hypothetical protein